MQEGNSPGVDSSSLVYSTAAIYELVMKPTSNLVNLVVANRTFVDDPSGVARRTVELSIVNVYQPACAARVRPSF